MPRPAAKDPLDMMDDDHAEEWETVSEDFGTKLVWEVGTVFIGIFTGTREVELDNSDDGFTNVTAAEFTSNGEKFYSWLTFALAKAFTGDDAIAVGTKVRIHCTGETATKRGLNPVKVFTIQTAK
jgi:hypothetical protein